MTRGATHITCLRNKHSPSPAATEMEAYKTSFKWAHLSLFTAISEAFRNYTGYQNKHARPKDSLCNYNLQLTLQ